MRDHLGCGYPPRASIDRTLARRDPDKPEWITPAQAVVRGLPAYEQLGYGPVKIDWPWCPRWFYQFSDVQIQGRSPLRFFQRAARYRDNGELSSLIPPPWTAALVDGLELYDRLEAERQRQDWERRKAQAKKKGRSRGRR